MRIWDIPPDKLCRNHLLGKHSEIHAIWSILTKNKKRFANHPETLRWRGKLRSLYLRHGKIVQEMKKRGFSHKSILDSDFATGKSVQKDLINPIEDQIKLLRSKKCKCINFWDIIQPTGGGPENGTYLIEPFDNICISELSLYYLGLFLLSSLVRYHPQIWMHSLSHLATSDLPSDDAALALIEKFLEDTLYVFPSAIVKAMSMKVNNHQLKLVAF